MGNSVLVQTENFPLPTNKWHPCTIMLSSNNYLSRNKHNIL